MTTQTIQAVTAFIASPTPDHERTLRAELWSLGLTKQNETIEAINRLLRVLYPARTKEQTT